MSHKGRCFRDRRRAAARKARQHAAEAALRRAMPGVTMHGPFGRPRALRFSDLNPLSKQRIVEGFNQLVRRGLAHAVRGA